MGKQPRLSTQTRLLRRPQLVVVWGVGLIVSGLLFQFGLGQHMANEAALRKAWASSIRNLKAHVEGVREAREKGEAYPGQLKEKIAELEESENRLEERERKRREAEAHQNPYIGIVAPVVILGICAFLSTLRRQWGPDD